ncbi:MAG TPA: virulence factor [Acidimicrobiales bacterium]|nr:virulence factor [Acidimicrobiales bacterium]
MASSLITIYWRDIPAQITAQSGRIREKALLDSRFQLAIDQAAMVAGLSSTDDYVRQWRREAQECGPDLAAAVAEEITKIEVAYPPERVKNLVRSGGVESSSDK